MTCFKQRHVAQAVDEPRISLVEQGLLNAAGL